MPEAAIYVGRPSRWGNPHALYATSYIGVRRRRDPAEAVALFRRMFEAFSPDYQRVELAPLRGHDLVCWCPLDRPCHADVLLELANR